MPKANTKTDGTLDPTVKVTVSMPTSLAARLDELAATERRTRSNAAAILIERGLELLTVPAPKAREAG